MSHPYSIYVWQPPLTPYGEGHWIEAVQCLNEQWAIYAAGLIHNAGVPHADMIQKRPVVKAVRYGGIPFLCLPDEHTVELIERQIAKQRRETI